MTVIELKKYIYTNNKIEYILQEIGCGHIMYHSQKEYYSCSNVNGDNKSAVNVFNNSYLNCRNYTREKEFGDKADLLTLVQYNKQLNNPKFSFFDTVKYLHNLLGLKLSLKTETKKKEIVDPLAVFKKVTQRRSKQNVLDFNPIDETELQDFVPYIHIDFFREGIIKKTIQKFGLAYSYRFKRTVIPLRYWLTGELLGFNMRTSIKNYDLFDIPKYYITPSYPKQMNLFGLWENRQSIQEKGYATVFESEKSVLKRDSLLDETGVALQGHTISDEQIKILIGLNVEIIIALDKDISINEVRHMCEKFYGIRKVSYMYDKHDLLGEKDSPADAPNKIFEFMMKFRIVYDEKEHKEYLKSLNKR